MENKELAAAAAAIIYTFAALAARPMIETEKERKRRINLRQFSPNFFKFVKIVGCKRGAKRRKGFCPEQQPNLAALLEPCRWERATTPKPTPPPKPKENTCATD